jgi:hypothetical protein
MMTNSWLAPKSSASRHYRALFKHMPLAVNQIAGALLYPHLD